MSTYKNSSVDWKVNGQKVFGQANFDIPMDNSYDPLGDLAPSALKPETTSISAAVSGSNDTELTLTCPAETAPASSCAPLRIRVF